MIGKTNIIFQCFELAYFIVCIMFSKEFNVRSLLHTARSVNCCLFTVLL